MRTRSSGREPPLCRFWTTSLSERTSATFPLAPSTPAMLASLLSLNITHGVCLCSGSLLRFYRYLLKYQLCSALGRLSTAIPLKTVESTSIPTHPICFLGFIFLLGTYQLQTYHIIYLSYLLPKYALHESWDFCLFYSFIYPQYLKQHLAQGRHSGSI